MSRRRRVVRVVRTLLVGSLLACAVLVAWVLWGGLLEQVAEHRLSAAFGGRVEIDRIEFQWLGGCAVYGVRVWSNDEGEGEPQCTLERVELSFKRVPTHLESIALYGLRLRVEETEDGISPRWIFAARESEGAMPAMLIEDGVCTFSGDGPIHERMRQYLADPSQLTLEIVRFQVAPNDADDAYVLGGSFIPPVGVEVFLRGKGGAEGLEHVKLWVERSQPIDLADERVRGRIAPELRDLLDANHAYGRLAYVAELQVPPNPESLEAIADGLSVEFELLDFDVTPEVFPSRLEDLSGSVVLRGRDLEVRDVSGWHGDARVHIDGIVEDLPGRQDLRMTATAVSSPLTTELRTAIGMNPDGAEFLDAFQPSGRFDAVTRVQVEHDAQGTPKVRMWHELELLDVSLRFDGSFSEVEQRRVGFPLAIRRTRGSLVASPGELQWDDVVAETESGAVVRCSGLLRWHENEPSGWVHIEALQMALDDAFVDAGRGAFGDDFAATWADLGLGGHADFDVLLTVQDGQLVDGTEVLIKPREVQFSHVDFPLPIRFEGGSVRISDDRIELDRIQGLVVTPRVVERPGGSSSREPEQELGAVELDGWIDVSSEAVPLSLSMRGFGVALEGPFRQACASLTEGETEGFWAACLPTGSIDLSVEWERGEDPLDRTVQVRVDPLDVRLDPPKLGLPITQLTGAAHLRSTGGEPWSLSLPKGGALRGECLGGRVAVVGSTQGGATPDQGRVGSFTVSAERLRIVTTERQGRHGFPNLFDPLQALAPDLAAMVEGLGPEGWVRMNCDVEVRDGTWDVTRVAGGPDRPPNLARDSLLARDGITLHLPVLGQPLHWNGGLIEGDLESRQWRFLRLDGALGKAPLALRDGSVEWNDDGIEASLRGSLGAAPLGSILTPMLDDAQRSRIARWDLAGTTHTDLTQVRFRIPAGATRPSMLKLDADVQLVRCGRSEAKRAAHLDGRLQVHVNYRDEMEAGPTMQVTADLGDARLQLGDLQWSGVSSKLVLGRDELLVREIQGEYAGGRLDPDVSQIRIPLAPGDRYEAHVHLRGADVGRILGDGHSMASNLAGRLDAEVTVFGDSLDPSEARAEGMLQVRDGELWAIPIFDRLYDLGISSLLGQSERPHFEEGTLHFWFQGGVGTITDLHLRGPTLTLDGRGAMGPGRFHMHFEPEVLVDLPFVDLPFVGSIVQGVFSLIEREALSFRFVGPYGDPSVRWDPSPMEDPLEYAQDLDRPRRGKPPALGLSRRF